MPSSTPRQTPPRTPTAPPRTRWISASSETTLSVGQRHAATVHDSLTADLAAWEDRDQAAGTLATATAKLTTATTTLEKRPRGPGRRPSRR